MIMLPSPPFRLSCLSRKTLFSTLFFTRHSFLAFEAKKEKEAAALGGYLTNLLFIIMSFRNPSTGAAISTDSLSQHFPWVKIFLEPQLFPEKRIIFRRNNRESQDMVSLPNANEQMIWSQNAKIALGTFLSVDILGKGLTPRLSMRDS